MLDKSVPVFCYHAVCEEDGHSPATFASHLDMMLEMGFKTITADHLYEICMGRRRIDDKYVVLTFDDCHISNWLNVVPMLEERGMTGVFFAVSDFIGDGKIRSAADVSEILPMREAFIKALSEKDNSQFMNEAELKSLVHDKGMEVYAHTCRHQGCFKDFRSRGNYCADSHWSTWGIYRKFNPELPVYECASAFAYNGFWPVFRKGKVTFKRRSDEDRRKFCREDFRKCLDKIKKINGSRKQFFCWPWGHFDSISMQEAAACGFSGTFTLERSANMLGTDPMRFNRIGVGSGKDADWIKKRLLMYSNEASAMVCFKFFNKRNDIGKVLYITDTRKLSGGSRQLINSARAMLAVGVGVVAVLPSESGLIPELEELGAEIIIFDDFKNILGAASFLSEVIEDNQIDVVHTFHNRAVKISCLTKGLSLLGGRKFKLFFNRGVIYKPNCLAPLFSLIGNGYICNSAKSREVLLKNFVPPKRVQVVYNSFAGGGRKPRRSADITIVYVGNSGHAKGPDVYIRAVDELLSRHEYEGVRFIAVGMEDLSAYKGMVADSTLKRIECPGYISHEEVVNLLAASHIYVMSSRKESMPNTLLEAFDAGLAAVCTDAGGTGELIRDGVNGFLCRIEDSAALAEGMKKLIDDGELRKEMGRLNRRIVRAFMSNAAKSQALLKAYSSLPGDEPLTALPDIDSLIDK
ncbi:glycosyltransferase [Maridesulfovibrio hydrothermalis]|uniref:Glycosyl transferase group 1 n=1 Tax=Maridesulfovibrio hydrothermalis AM13 = DSM 14728 TaxID=1121451 RepID=L0R909_9BACT|nr:glycosyltransferase [Maridesulfovibrio hydrothermalis]CCO22670.1 Glycosyl transferase group 1 [Maridesulfovibrio hydrothermalis AM13 = DSM 14728]